MTNNIYNINLDIEIPHDDYEIINKFKEDVNVIIDIMVKQVGN